MSGCWQRRLVPTLFAYQRVAGTWIWHNQGGRHSAVLQTFVPSQCSGDTKVHSVGGAGGGGGREEATAAPALIDQCRLLAGRGQKN